MFNKTLRNNIQLPQIGLGTWQITNRDVVSEVIAHAFNAGYRLIDTAAAYSNEMAIAKAIAALGLPREEYYLADKAWNTSRGYAEVQEACKRSLRKLKTEYLDLYLIHWPASMKLYTDWAKINAETWRGLEELYRQGLVRAIGVCNFKVHHLEELKKTAEIMPHINQIECHPGMNQQEVTDYCHNHGIVVEASSPLGNGQILSYEGFLNISSKYGKTAAQLCIRWLVQRGLMAIPKSVRLDRLKENIDIFDFEIEEDDMRIIGEMPYCGGIGIDADEVKAFG